MADDRKKGRGRAKLLLAVLVGMFVVLTAVYWARFQALPFGNGRFVKFLKVWEWIR